MVPGYRYTAGIISYPVWLYDRLNLSLRNVEELLAESTRIYTRVSDPVVVAEYQHALGQQVVP